MRVLLFGINLYIHTSLLLYVAYSTEPMERSTAKKKKVKKRNKRDDGQPDDARTCAIHSREQPGVLAADGYVCY